MQTHSTFEAWLLGEPRMRALRSGSFPYGNGLRNAEGGPPVFCMGLFAVKQVCSGQGKARCLRQFEVMESRPESSAYGGTATVPWSLTMLLLRCLKEWLTS